MTDDRRFTETDHDALAPGDILARAIDESRDEMPAQDLWPGIAARLDPAAAARPRQFSFTLPQLALAASLLIAVASGLTWLAARPPAAAAPQAVVFAQGEGAGVSGGQVVNANFADAQYDAAVTDLEQILLDERDQLDPRTVLVIERNLKAIDAAIREARAALDDDPGNPYLNSHLADARRRKLALLRHATTLPSAGGN
jgi:hypothetical protein